jgi:hypothetical protein
MLASVHIVWMGSLNSLLACALIVCMLLCADAYRSAVALNPRDYRAWYGLGQTYELLSMPYYALHYYRCRTAGESHLLILRIGLFSNLRSKLLFRVLLRLCGIATFI